MFQESELITLILGFIALAMIVFIFGKKGLPRPHFLFFFMGFIFLFCSYIFTVIEGVLWNGFFNLLEHLCLFLAGLTFALGCREFIRNTGTEEESR